MTDHFDNARLNQMAENWQAGTIETELFTAAGQQDIAAVKRVMGAWKKTAQIGDWDRAMEQTLSESLKRPPSADPTDTKIGPVTQYLLQELPDIWGNRPASMTVSWSQMLTRVMDRFQAEREEELQNSPPTSENGKLLSGWAAASVTGVLLALVASGANPDPYRMTGISSEDLLNPRSFVRPCLNFMSKLKGSGRGLVREEDVDPPLFENGLKPWAMDVDRIEGDTDGLASWIMKSIRNAFPKGGGGDQDEASSIPLGQHGKIYIAGGARPIPILMLQPSERMKVGLVRALGERLVGILDKIPADLFFEAAGQCLMWPEDKEGDRPGPAWTGLAELSGEVGRCVRQLTADGDVSRKYLRSGYGRRPIDWANQLLRRADPQDHARRGIGHLAHASSKKDTRRVQTGIFRTGSLIHQLISQRMWNLARATSVEDTCRTMVDLFLVDVVQNWIPKLLQEKRENEEAEQAGMREVRVAGSGYVSVPAASIPTAAIAVVKTTPAADGTLPAAVPTPATVTDGSQVFPSLGGYLPRRLRRRTVV